LLNGGFDQQQTNLMRACMHSAHIFECYAMGIPGMRGESF